MRIPRIFSQNHIIGGTVILAVTQFGASAMGLVRDKVFNTVLTTDVTDVYFAAFRPSDFLFQTCVMAAMGTVLVPVLASYKAHGKSREVSKVLSSSMFLGGIIFGVIALLGGIFLPVLAPFLVKFEGEQLALYIQFGRLALFSNFLFVFGNTLGQYLITSQKYWMYGITPIIYTLCTVLGAMFLTPHVGAYGPILGTIIGTVLYTIFRLADALRLGFRPSADVWHPDFPGMAGLMLPRILSLGALQFQLLMFDRIASGLGDGGVSINSYARNFQSVLVGVTGIALAQSAYSLLGQAAAWKNEKLFKKYLLWGFGALLAITVPGSIALVLLAPYVARAMSIEDIVLFSSALLVYAVSIPFESMNHLMLRAYYATKQTLIPAVATVAGAIAAIGVSSAFSGRLSIQSIGLGFTAGQITVLLILAACFASVRKRVRA
jgi:murein biosynthesis integral membrane protein MurJ